MPSLPLKSKLPPGWLAVGLMATMILLPGRGVAQSAAAQGALLSAEGHVEFSPQRAAWAAAITNQLLKPQDRLRTLAASRAMVQLVDLGRVRVDERTTLEILAPRHSKSKGTLDLKAGAMYFFTRDRPREFEIQTPQALAATRGTEFLVSLEPDGRELFVVYDGEVELTNNLGGVVVLPGEQGIVAPGQPPRKTAVIEARRIVQWWLYYPAVLNPEELSLSPAQRAMLTNSLAAYQQGDLLNALREYPAGRNAENEDERIFHAALLLSVGQVTQAEALLTETNSNVPAARALRLMMDTVQMREAVPLTDPQTAAEWLANSYALQARYDLPAALVAARKAAVIAPDFGFASARVAELEFSFGRRHDASTALNRALSLSPRNAQAWALKGFLFSAQRDWPSAAGAFETAIALDPALGNAWLGRGLLKIRGGDREGGRADLQTGVALEPNRSVLRSYLGKAFDHARDDHNAARELDLAKQLDAEDPTPWLYSALILRQQLRYNEAVTDLEKSSRLNDNRQVYRSRLLLDQDQAVRSASLATIYRAAGMEEVSVREAARAVTFDYANYSAHQFLAESYDALRDPTQFNLRYDIVWFSELLLSRMLSPVGGGNLSQNISQQEYTRLFAQDPMGFSSSTEYRSDGQVRELATHFGTVDKFSYALDLDYQHNDGVRPNNELDRLIWHTTAKYELGPQSSLFLFTRYQDYKSGDNFQYYDPTATRRDLEIFGITNAPIIRTDFTFEEYQKPVVLIGLHHEWAPGVHTLLLGGRLENEQIFTHAATPQLILSRDGNTVVGQSSELFNVNHRNEYEIYSFELNQIFQSDRQLLVVGGRYQNGTFKARDRITLVNTNLSSFFDLSGPVNVRADFERISGYGYYTLELLRNLHVTAGLAYDRITQPVNYRYSPIAAGSSTEDQLSPKAALVWSFRPEVTLRGVYTRSLEGASADENYRLEPAQLAGFSQTFRTLIPESVAGSVSGPKHETAGAALDLAFKTRTYLSLQGEYLTSEVHREIGVFDYSGGFPPPPPITTSTMRESLEYEEPSVSVTVNQLLSDYWSLGAQYRFARSVLNTTLPEIPISLNPGARRTEEADLHQARLFLLLNHPSGFFARAESLWFHQENRGYTPALPGDDFFQHNLYVGYRLKRQRAEISLAVLNLADTDYRLNPLNAYSELPRERVFLVRLKMNF
ncbi:MAG: TonB-dependent receptor [Akkermansiaceae bacterium]|nr:TonB-dependent receptor [Verrucomicrobiales bacterium]